MRITQKTLGYGLMMVHVVSWMVSGTAVQLLHRQIPDFQLGVLRYIGSTLLGAAVMGCGKKRPADIPKELYIAVITLGMCTAFFNILQFFAVSFLPLSHTSSIQLVFTMLMLAIAPMVLYGEKLPGVTLLAMVSCSVGLLLLVQPWLDFKKGFTAMSTKRKFNHSSNSGNSNINDSPSRLWLIAVGYIILALAGGIQAMYVTIAGVHLKHVDAGVIFFVTSAIAAVVCFVCSLYVEEPVLVTDPYIILLASLHVVGASVAVLAEIYACQLIGPVQVAISDNAMIIVNLLPQYTILGGYLYGRRNVLEVFGCLITTISIICSVLLNNNEIHEDLP